MSRREIALNQLTIENGFLVVRDEPEAEAAAKGAKVGALIAGPAGAIAGINSQGEGKRLIPLRNLVEIRREASGRYRVVIDVEQRPEVAEAPRRMRVPGSAKGQFTVPDDFDAPLDDFRDYM